MTPASLCLCVCGEGGEQIAFTISDIEARIFSKIDVILRSEGEGVKSG